MSSNDTPKQIYLSAKMINDWDINLLKALAEEYQIVTTPEGMQAIKDKDIEANFLEQLQALKDMATALRPKQKIKSSKNKHKSNLTPPKKKRR